MICKKYECNYNGCGKCYKNNITNDEMQVCEIYMTDNKCIACICGDCEDNIYYNENGTCTRCKNDKTCPSVYCSKTTDDKQN